MYKGFLCPSDGKKGESAVFGRYFPEKGDTGVAYNGKRGVTLGEICIVLAVVSIVSLAVVSFAVMATGRSATGTDRLKAMQDIALLEETVERWFEEVYKPGGITVEEQSLSMDGKALLFTNGALVIDGTQTYPFETVKALKFEKLSQGNDDIYFCTVTYVCRRGRNGNAEESYTFCVNPRVGEQIKGY